MDDRFSTAMTELQWVQSGTPNLKGNLVCSYNTFENSWEFPQYHVCLAIFLRTWMLGGKTVFMNKNDSF